MRKTGTKKHESDFQEDVLEYLKTRGGHWTKVHVSAYQSQGEPDIIGCYMGAYVAFELKVDNNETSALQDYKLAEITSNGGYAFAPRTLKEVKEVLDDIYRVQSNRKP